MSSQNYEHMATCHYEANVVIGGQFESSNDPHSPQIMEVFLIKKNWLF
jgi:hypothetical protein